MENGKNKSTRLTLPSDREIVITRDFRAPKSLVFETWSKPEHLEHWYACPSLLMPTCEMDFRVGGAWRIVLRDRETTAEHALSGEYKEIDRPDRLVFTERYEPIPGSDHVVTVTFVEHDGVTTLTQQFMHSSNAARDAHLKSGMETGLEETFERLEKAILLLGAPR